MSGEQLHEILKEIDTNMNGQVELDEYLQVHIAIRDPMQRLTAIDQRHLCFKHLRAACPDVTYLQNA